MAQKTVNWKMRQRQGTAAQWAGANPVLAAGEFGYDTTNDIVKIGDGVKKWSSLPTFSKKKYDLNTMSWAEISEIARDGRAPMLFNIGDEKTVKLSTGEVITLVILDFWHDDYYDEDNDEDIPAGITFGMKNCLSTRYQMNASNTNVGGWSGSAMHNVMQTLYSQLPADLRSVIIPVKKKTSAGNKSTTINTTTETIWLLSRVEVDGTDAATYKDEGVQYPYFKRNNVAVVSGYYGNPNYVKGLSDGEGSAYDWWLRSPYVAYSYYFWCVSYDGSVYASNASISVGVSFGFCV